MYKRQVQQAVAAGKVGKPEIIKITSRDPEPPSIDYVKVSGGMFLDMTIHDFDMVRFLAGCDATEVYVQGANLVDPAIGEAGDVDTAVITLQMENGAIAVIDNCRKAVYGYDPVSYTHLDVYKRQPLKRWRRSSAHSLRS